MNLKFDIVGKKKVMKILSSLGGRVTNLKPAFKNIASNFLELERITFEKEGRRGEWRPLSLKYAAWKSKRYPGKKKLVLIGNLKESLISRGGDHIERIGRKSLVMGTKNKLGDWHQKGAGSLPVRKPINPTTKDHNEWVNIIRSFVVEKLGFTRSGF